jgi:hypothetical protein
MFTMNPFHVAKLAVIAAHLSGYLLPAQLPVVHELNRQEMIARACAEGADAWDSNVLILSCPVVGMYADDDQIYVDAEVANKSGLGFDEDSVVIHELTHWLQHHAGKAGFECPRIEEREREAYHIQNIYIHAIERNEGGGVTMPDGICP